MRQAQLRKEADRLKDTHKGVREEDNKERHTPVEAIVCEHCGEAEADDSMLLCDRCLKGYHRECMQPPMTAIPEGDWICEECKPSGDQGEVASTIAKTTVDITKDAAVTDYMKEKTCPENITPAEKNRIRNRASRFYYNGKKICLKATTSKFGAREVPRMEDRPTIINSLHSFGHFGIQRTANMVQERDYWPGIFGDVIRTIEE